MKARLITITDWQKDENDFPQMDLFWFEAWYPQTFFAFGNPQVKGSYGAWLLQDPITGHYNIWRPNKWTHVCFSYEKKTSFIRMVKVSIAVCSFV